MVVRSNRWGAFEMRLVALLVLLLPLVGCAVAALMISGVFEHLARSA
jgi:hypothetical protein